jgi:hypothetical protein
VCAPFLTMPRLPCRRTVPLQVLAMQEQVLQTQARQTHELGMLSAQIENVNNTIATSIAEVRAATVRPLCCPIGHAALFRSRR